MSALPEGKVRPPIDPPRLGSSALCNPIDSVRIVKLTSYRLRDTSEYTIRDFDYRLRWTLYASHVSMTGDGKGTRGHAHVTVDVWSPRDHDWHQVWELSRQAESPYSTDTRRKVRTWNMLLGELAQYATEVLL